MKRCKIIFASIIALLFFMCPAFATVAVNDIDGYVGEVTNIDFEGQKVSFDGSKVTVFTNGHAEGVTINVSTESNLTSAELAFGLIRFQAGTTKTIDIAEGTRPGQMVTLGVYDAGVNITIDPDSYAVPRTARTGWSKILIASPGTGSLGKDYTITLLWLDDTNGWIIVGNNGCTVIQKANN